MGYNIYITRKTNWFEEDTANDITMKEWQEYISTDLDMKPEESAETKTRITGEKVTLQIPGLAVWMKYSKNEPGFNMAWFLHSQGNISVKNPDPEIIQKMYEIAQKLDANLQGEEGEYYDYTGKMIKTEPDKIKSGNASKPWWKFWST